eukprot:TRINITY_DN3004_c0_g1_i1.p1 TRINITY_DN3004_c0_g1~~TRINITY_DN3004_c0_g1_i1.p1  ORF type:complete len:713 (+),score=90.41 TRINITY_DN3004_c0_g1_i1:25-2139(+)
MTFRGWQRSRCIRLFSSVYALTCSGHRPFEQQGLQDPNNDHVLSASSLQEVASKLGRSRGHGRAEIRSGDDGTFSGKAEMRQLVRKPDVSSFSEEGESTEDEHHGKHGAKRHKESEEERRERYEEKKEHKEAERREHHSHDAELHYGFLVGLTLLAFLVFVMYVLYMTQNSDPQLSAYSYKIISLSIGIYLAVMGEDAQSQIFTQAMVKFMKHDENLDGTYADEVILLVLMIFWYFFMTVLCRWYRDSDESLEVIKIVVMHLGVFVAIELFGGVQRDLVEMHGHDFYSRLRVHFAFPFVIVLFCKVLSIAGEALRKSWLAGDAAGHGDDNGHEEGHSRGSADEISTSLDVVDAHEHDHGNGDGGSHEDGHGHGHHPPHWVHVSIECEDEFSGLLFGCLLARGITYLCTTKMQDELFDNGWVAAPADALLKMGAAVAVTGALFIASTKLPERLGEKYAMFAEYIEIHLQFLCTWVALDLLSVAFANSFYRHEPPDYQNSETIQRTYIAFSTAPIIMVGLWFVDFMGDRNMLSDFTANEVIESIGLLTGLVWERAFHSGLHAIIHKFSLSGHIHNLLTGIAQLFIIATVIPAWKWYIVPTSLKPIAKREYVTKGSSNDKPEENVEGATSADGERTAPPVGAVKEKDIAVVGGDSAAEPVPTPQAPQRTVEAERAEAAASSSTEINKATDGVDGAGISAKEDEAATF